MTPPTDRLSTTPSHMPATQVRAPSRADPATSERVEEHHGAIAAAGAATRAMGRIVPTAGTSVAMVRHIRTSRTASTGPPRSPAAR